LECDFFQVDQDYQLSFCLLLATSSSTLAAGLIGQLQILSFFCYSLNFFVIFLRVRRFEGEGVGTVFLWAAFVGTALEGTVFVWTAFLGTAFVSTAFVGTAFVGTVFVGTAFVYFDNFSVCHVYVLVFSCF
jgi:hypothetical protein